MSAKPEYILAMSEEDESSWAEAVDTWGTRHQIIGQPTVSLTQPRIMEEIQKQQREEGKAGVLSVRGGEVSFTYALTGYGATTESGGLTATDIASILAHAIGDISTSNQGRGINAVTDAAQFEPDGIFEAGALVRVGALGDGRAEGQWCAMNNGTTATLLTALPAAPNTFDSIFGALMVYPWEDPGGATITSKRMLIQTANAQYKLRGVFPTSISIQGVNAGEIPTVTVTYAVSWWDFADETFPNATATDAKDAAICANGSCFVQDVGTTTRDTHQLRSWSINIALEVVPLLGQDAVNTYQNITGAVRTRCSVELETTFDAEASGTRTWADKFDAGTFQHILIGLSVADGKALGFYFPKAEITQRPTQVGMDGLNRVTCNWRCLSSDDAASARTLSSFRIGMG